MNPRLASLLLLAPLLVADASRAAPSPANWPDDLPWHDARLARFWLEVSVPASEDDDWSDVRGEIVEELREHGWQAEGGSGEITATKGDRVAVVMPGMMCELCVSYVTMDDGDGLAPVPPRILVDVPEDLPVEPADATEIALGADLLVAARPEALLARYKVELEERGWDIVREGTLRLVAAKKGKGLFVVIDAKDGESGLGIRLARGKELGTRTWRALAARE